MQNKDKELQASQITPMQGSPQDISNDMLDNASNNAVSDTRGEYIDEFDTGGEIDELETLSKELQDAEASLEGNFAKFISDKVNKDASLEELFFSDREEFFIQVLKEQNDFVKNLIEPKMNRANELASSIQNKQSLEKMSLLKRQFESEHPDIDINVLLDFFINEVPPRVQEQIRKAPIEQFFEMVYAYYNQLQGPSQEAQGSQGSQGSQEGRMSPPSQENLPAQAQGVYIPSDNIGTGNILPMERA